MPKQYNHFITTDEIAIAVTKVYGLVPEQIANRQGRRPSNLINEARQMVSFLCYHLTGNKCSDIAKFLNLADHTPVSLGIKVTRNVLSVDKDVQKRHSEILALLKRRYPVGIVSKVIRLHEISLRGNDIDINTTALDCVRMFNKTLLDLNNTAA